MHIGYSSILRLMPPRADKSAVRDESAPTDDCSPGDVAPPTQHSSTIGANRLYDSDGAYEYILSCPMSVIVSKAHLALVRDDLAKECAITTMARQFQVLH